MLRRYLLSILILFLLMLPASLALSQNQGAPACYLGALSRYVGWGTSGVAVPHQNRLLLVDTGSEKVLNVTFKGQVEVAQGFKIKKAGLALPLHIRSGKEDYLLLQLQPLEGRLHPQILRVDGDLTPKGEPFIFRDRPFEASTGVAYEVRAVFDFVPLGDGILALADLMNMKNREDLFAAFVYVDFRNYSITILHKLKKPDEIKPYVVNIFTPYIAALDQQTGFVLLFDHEPRIRRFDVHTRELAEKLPSFPDDIQYFPRLQTLEGLAIPGWRRHTVWYRQLEATPRLVTGLYSWRNRLFLLGRQGAPRNGDPKWWLFELDPSNGSELGRTTLPTQAAHLSIVPGEDFWTVVERGPVQALPKTYAPYMSTASTIQVPTAWLTGADTRGPSTDPKVARKLCRPAKEQF